MNLPIIGKPIKIKLSTGEELEAIYNSQDKNGAIFEDVNCIDHKEKDIVEWEYIKCR